MSSIRKKKLKRLVLMTMAATALHLQAGGIVHAEDTTITDGNYDYIYGGGNESNTEPISDNVVSIDGGTFDGIFGGMSSTGAVSNNRIVFNNGTVSNGIVGGVTFFSYGSSESAGDVTGNFVEINGGRAGYVSGGEVTYLYPSTDSGVPDVTQNYFSQGGNVYNNSVEINGGTITGAVNGGSALTGSAYNNTITIKNGTVSGNVIGGEVRYPTSHSAASNNIINIGDPDTYSGSPNLVNAYFIGGLLGSSSTSAGNNLNIYTSGITIGGIDFSSFEKVNFMIPSSVQRNGQILTLRNGVSNVDLGKIGIALDGNSNLDTNDTVRIIVNGGSTASSSDLASDGSYNSTMSKGATLLYDVNLAQASSGDIVATIGEVNRPSDNPIPDMHKEEFPFLHNEIPDPFTGMMVDNMLVDDSGASKKSSNEDLKSDEAEEIVNPTVLSGFSIFLNTGGGHIKTKTGSGTYIKTSSGNFDLGFARSLETSSGSLYIAPVFEYVRGNYDSLLPNDIHGNGSTQYTAGGFIFRKVNKSGVYYESSLRGGRAKNSFASNDFMINNEKTRVTYDMSAPVLTGHFRFGNAKRLNQNNLFDVFGVYSYARQNGMSTTLSSGDNVNFSSVDSHSLRLGYRLTTRTSKISRIYTGLAYQYDTNSDSTATAAKYSKTAAGAKGSSGMLELGWQIKPYRDNPWLLDINAVGWTGHHQGFSAMAKIQKSF